MVNFYVGIMLSTSIIIVGVFAYLILTKQKKQIQKILSDRYKTVHNYLDKLEFNQIFILFTLLVGVVLSIIVFITKLNATYLSIYYFFVLITFFLIKEVSKILRIKNKTLSKFSFFKFCLKYLGAIIAYVILFALLYRTIFLLGNGAFLYAGVERLVNLKEALFISGFTFFSYDINLIPNDFMEFGVLIEIALSQIILLGFMFIVFDAVFRKLKLRPLPITKDLKKTKRVRRSSK